MRTVIATAMCIAALSACSSNPRPRPVVVLAEPAPPNPFDNSSTSFVVSGPRFPPGETAIVKVCVSADGVIASADVVGSSGDKRFDDFALVWARQVKLGNLPQGDQAKEICGPVRVEIKAAPLPRILSAGDSALG
jgi:TonB family protein